MQKKVGMVEKVTLELWVRPGEHQTLEDLRAKFRGRILRENDNGEILVSMTEEVPTSPR